MSEFSVVREKPLSGKNQIRQNLEPRKHRGLPPALQPTQTIYSGRVTGWKLALLNVESIRREA
jgi:hypothetical protein